MLVYWMLVPAFCSVPILISDMEDSQKGTERIACVLPNKAVVEDLFVLLLFFKSFKQNVLWWRMCWTCQGHRIFTREELLPPRKTCMLETWREVTFQLLRLKAVIKVWVACNLVLHTCSNFVTLWVNSISNRQSHQIKHTKPWQVATVLNGSLA